MSSALEKHKKQITILIQLAKVDGILSDDELQMINRISKMKGISSSELEDLFYEEGNVQDLPKMSEKDRFVYLYTIVQLMKIDDRLYKEEMIFSLEACETLQFDVSILHYLMLNIAVDPASSPPEEALRKELAKKGLLKKGSSAS
ncbi:MAG: hypothetical protein OXB93_06720 [Cytophagales bacterium]|nr:hypothetical protein [Cytophagales bacterium]